MSITIRETRTAIAPHQPTHIEVIIKSWSYKNLADMADYESALRSIKRHVDDIDTAEIHTARVCLHCDGDPEFDDEGPCCCNPAVDEYARLVAEAS